MDISKIPPGTPNEVNVIIENPQGTHNKYEFDKDMGAMMLDRVLFSPFFYPADYGFIPQTLCEDGDPLDALVLVTNPTFPGCVIKARILGVMHMIDGGEADDKLLCVPVSDPRWSKFKSLDDVNKHVLDEIAHFFKVYKDLEGKKVEVKGWKGVEDGKKVFKASIELFNKK